MTYFSALNYKPTNQANNTELWLNDIKLSLELVYHLFYLTFSEEIITLKSTCLLFFTV